MSLLIGQAAGALGFLTSLSPSLGSSGTSGSVGQNFAQAANSNTAAVTNPLNPLLDGQVRNAPSPNVLAPDTINALFTAQSQGSPPANTARTIATPSVSNFLDQLTQGQIHALGSFTGQSVSVTA